MMLTSGSAMPLMASEPAAARKKRQDYRAWRSFGSAVMTPGMAQ